jgi:nicotinamide phosphoribosyltransferase
MTFKVNPLLMTDGYKTSHRLMYPKATNLVYSNYTCRSIKYMPDNCKDIVVFGTQYVFQYIHELFEEQFFKQPKEKVCQEAKDYLSAYLGTEYEVSHFKDLHDLGYLPIEVKALEEGNVIGAGIPLFTIKNTHVDFFWVTNFLETLISTLIWKPVHSASLAYGFRKILEKYSIETGVDPSFIPFQGHDFSFRGMQSPESAISSGLGFLTSFSGTDTLPVLQASKHFYNSENVGFSVPASEHSVMCSHGKEGEIETLKYLMNQYPTGILSVVSDTWDLWKLIIEYLPQLKEEILSRDGKLVIRPDSGDPVDIICGLQYSSIVEAYEREGKYFAKKVNDNSLNINNYTEILEPEYKGVIELLWDVFGGTINEQGYKVLDPHIGVIYGDSITPERAIQIAERLKAKGFANQVVYGVGSYSLGYATRDSQGGAVKSTYVEVNCEPRPIFKDPITDNGTKKSAKGLLKVNENFELEDNVSWEEEATGMLLPLYIDGTFLRRTTLEEIKMKLHGK